MMAKKTHHWSSGKDPKPPKPPKDGKQRDHASMTDLYKTICPYCREPFDAKLKTTYVNIPDTLRFIRVHDKCKKGFLDGLR